MKLSFTIEEFLEVFRQYNMNVWPAQILIIILALAAVYFSIKKVVYSDKIIASILCFFWLWMGIVYHLIYFSEINKAAAVFGALFIFQGLLFLYFGVIQSQLQFQLRMNVYGITGIILVSFALLLYPALGYWLGHRYPSSPSFGLPCPTTIFTFGILLFSSKRLSILILLIPFLWSLIGFSAAFKLGMKEDLSLLFAGLVSMILILMRNRSLKSQGG
jgi:hypothetical protein